MRHRILLNGLLYAPDGTGVSRYAEHLVKAYLAERYDVDLLLREEYRAEYARYDNVLFAGREIHGSGERILTEQWQLRRLYRAYDLVHFPDYATPVLSRAPAVATVHDLSMKTMRRHYTWPQRITKNILLRNTVRRAAGVLCDSAFSRRELLRYYPQMEQKSAVVYLGVEAPGEKEKTAAALQKWALRAGQYFLYVGTLAPHKNLPRLLRAFSMLCRRDPDSKLVLAGGKGWMYEDVFSEAARLRLEERVVFTDYVPQPELETLYDNALCCVVPSLYEGFGLPPLEAMIRGVPVIVSDIAAFHETVGDCGLYCDPLDEVSILTQMETVLERPALRTRLSRRGKARARQFTWQRTARETWRFYESILGGEV